MDYFLEIFGTLRRAGPGSSECTQRAYAMMTELPTAPHILDIGCGPGVQTVDLLRLSGGTVVALDFLPEMIERTKTLAIEAGVDSRLTVLEKDMNLIDFQSGTFDVVWSEAAIYNMGFENGLRKIFNIVRPGGYVAVSEVVWLKNNPPAPLREYWQQYPEIDTVVNKLTVIERLGYQPVGSFLLPVSAWTENYYTPMEQRIAEKSLEWKGIPEAMAVLDEATQEIAIFRKYSDYFGYAFFVMRAPERK